MGAPVPPPPSPGSRLRAWFGAPPVRRRSRFWHVVPILAGLLCLVSVFGGIIAYLAIRKDDPGLARKCLVSSIVFTVFLWVSGYSAGFIEGFQSTCC